jgi:uridine phosphorylase
VFRPESLLRESRRLKRLDAAPVPAICVLDPDGDLVAHVRAERGTRPSPSWACFHTRLWEWSEGDVAFGVVGFAVGGSFAVLVAEQLFASGCELCLSIASAGQIAADGPPSDTILIERALRDEGTSHHYLPPSPFAAAEPALVELASQALSGAGRPFRRGATWTTDAPFRETAEAVAARRSDGILAVEMEAASLYAFARARARPVLCLARVTNQLGCAEGDFDKDERNGAASTLNLVRLISTGWLARQRA